MHNEFQKIFVWSRGETEFNAFDVYEKLGLYGMKPTRMTLHLADISVKYHVGITKDIKIRIGQLVVPTYFIVMDT